MTIKIETTSGILHIEIDNESRPLTDLLEFASRENPKRGFLFVSRVLGKHIPVKPSVMRSVYIDLSAHIGKGNSTYVVGMAETATGLGAGVADSLSRTQDAPVYYQHTTRHSINQPVWLQLDEAHSHAVDHILYEPLPVCVEGIRAAKRLVLVDDEISTGRTLRLLSEKLLPLLPEVQEVVIVSLVSWLTKEMSAPFENLPVRVRFVSLLSGRFQFEADPDFKVNLPTEVDKGLSHAPSSLSAGRCGLKMPYDNELPLIATDRPLTVVGDGEHLYLPFLAAERAEKAGHDVLFQSTTRSPVLVGQAIKSKLSFSIDERPVRHFIYNLSLDSSERNIMVFVEDESRRASHELAREYPIITRAVSKYHA